MVIQVRERMMRNRQDYQTSQQASENQTAQRIDEKLWRYVDELEADRTRVRQLAAEEATKSEKQRAELRADLVGLQAIYEQALARLELLEKQRIKDQTLIEELQAQVKRLESEQS